MSNQDEMLKYLKIQTGLLSTIQKTLERIEQNNAPASPNYRRRLSEFAGFDWASIGATVVASDDKGPVDVEWAGHRFDRAMGHAFNEDFVIFSRPAPGWTQQNKVYHTLIRFADYNKTPLDERRPPAPTRQQPAPATIKAEPPPRPIKALDVQDTRPAQALDPGKTIDGHALWNKIVELSLTSGKFDHGIVNDTLKEGDDWRGKAEVLAARLGVDLREAVAA